MGKRQTFRRLFLKRWTVWMVFGLVVSCAETGYAFSRMKELVYSKYTEASLSLKESFDVLKLETGEEGRMHTEEERRQMFSAMQQEMLQVQAACNFDFASVLYDEDMKPVCDSAEDSRLAQNIDLFLEKAWADKEWHSENVERVSEHFPKLEYTAYSLVSMDCQNYILTTGARFHFWEVCGGKCMSGYCVTAVLCTLLALLMARIRWIRLSAEYEMEDYRISLTNSMAHDLKSPLMAISGMAENLKNNIHSEKREYYADAILENVTYMNHIIEHVLELSKVEQGKLALRCEEIALKPVLEAILDRYETELEQREISATLEGELSLQADRILLAQALDNLLSNAVGFCQEQGTITIACKPDGLHISNTYRLDKDEIFQPDELVKPFVRGDASRGGKRGTGIGLTIAKNILEMHGYQLQLSYEEETFSVWLKVSGK